MKFAKLGLGLGFRLETNLDERGDSKRRGRRRADRLESDLHLSLVAGGHRHGSALELAGSNLDPIKTWTRSFVRFVNARAPNGSFQRSTLLFREFLNEFSQ